MGGGPAHGVPFDGRPRPDAPEVDRLPYMSTVCAHCGSEVPAGSRFCGSCGEAVGVVCFECGALLPEGAGFCPDCGTVVRRDAAPNEHKLVTVLFADISGSTALAEQLDPERFREVLSAFFDTINRFVETYGGTIEKYVGDAVLAVFGVPVAHGDDPDRALAAAHDTIQALDDLNTRLFETHRVKLSARIGINTGEVVAISRSGPEMGIVAGDPVHVAARLEQDAQPGQILVADRTVRASRRFRFRDLGAVTLRGREGPVVVHELLGPAGEVAAPLLHAPMVGRRHELTLLDTLLERVTVEERPHLVTIYGEAGIGKSRLIDEYRVTGPKAPVMRGRCLPYGEESSYRPLAEILKGRAGILDSDPPRRVIDKIEGVLETGAGAERTAAALGYTVGIDPGHFSFREMAPRQIEDEIRTAWRQFFSSIASRSPLVLEIEDIHWADPALLSLLEYLAERVEAPILFVCTARPQLADRVPGWGGGRRNFSSIMLDPLTEDQSSRLIALLLHIEAMPERVRRTILSRAEGNPFFIEEILRRLIDEGAIVRSGDRWSADEKISEVHIPDTVQAVLAARIDLLSGAEKLALQCAAVVGRVFWSGAVAALLGFAPGQADTLLDRLERRDLVRSRLDSSIEGEREYVFKHVLIRDVAFDSLSQRERTDFHRRAAEWVQRIAGDRLREVVEVLAYHSSRAYAGLRDVPSVDEGELEKIRRGAIDYLLMASESAKLRIALDSARRLAREAHRLAATTGEEARALEALGEAYFFAHEGDSAWENLRAAIDLHQEAGHVSPADLARICARALETPVRWPGSMQSVPPEADVHRYLQIGFAHAGASDTPERARLLTLEAFWPHAFPRPQERAHEALVSPERSIGAGEEAVAMARRLGRPDLESAALDGVGANYIALGRYDRALEGVNRRLELCDEIDDIWEVGDAHSMGGWANFCLGRYREAFSSADRGFAITATRLPSVAAHCLSWRALARYRLGDWDGVLADLDLVSSMLGDRSDSPPHYISAMHAAAALVHEIRGEPAGADHIVELLRRVDEGAEALDRDSTAMGRWAQYLAPLVARRGRLDEARRMLSGTTWRRGARMGLLLESECEIAVWAGEWEGARELLERARAEAERCGLEALEYAADRLDGHLALQSGEGTRAVHLLKRARAGFERLDARWDEAVTTLALGEALVETGVESNVPRVVGPAIDVFRELGAPRELAKAQSLIEHVESEGR